MKRVAFSDVFQQLPFDRSGRLLITSTRSHLVRDVSLRSRAVSWENFSRRRVVSMHHYSYSLGIGLALLLGGCSPSETTEEEPPARLPSYANSAEISQNLCEGRNGLALADASRWTTVPHARAGAAIQCDAQEIAARIMGSRLSPSTARDLRDRLLQIAAHALDEIDDEPLKAARLPLSSLHAQMFETAAESERGSNEGALNVWATNPWKPLHPLELADSSMNVLSTAMMRGERRSLALNIRSTSPEKLNVQIHVNVPGFPTDALRIYRVNWTGNDMSTWVAAELEPIGDASAPRETLVLPGITQQIWIEVNPDRSSTPGEFVGDVAVSSESAYLELPIHVSTLRATLPEKLPLHLGGWDYTEGPVHAWYAITDANRNKVIEYLKSRYVDIPWGLRRTLHWQNLDAAGSMVGDIDSSALSSWFASWPNASRYRLHLGVGDNIAGISETDSLFPVAVAAWARAWADKIRVLGKSPDQFDLLLVDEPTTEAEARTTELWSRAIRESGVGFRIWTDPLWSDPYATPSNLIGAADVVSINLGFAESSGTRYWEWMRDLTAQGKIVEIYATDGPARRLDPYTYYRLAAWRAFFAGASSLSFWSFVAQNKTPSMNEFVTEDGEDYNYSPLFITPEDVRPGKHMEAAAEGIQDIQYLTMLRDVANTHKNYTVRAQAQALLQGAESFIANAPRSSGAQWQAQVESSVADQQISNIGRFLDSLSE